MNTIEKYFGKKELKPQKIEKRTVFLFLFQNKVYIEKHTNSESLEGLYEYPSIEGHFTRNEIKYYLEEIGLYAPEIKRLESIKHIFSHKECHLQCYVVPLLDTSVSLKTSFNGGKWVTLHELVTYYSLPSAFHRYTDCLNDYLI